MSNFLNNSKPWMAATLFVASSVFGQSNCQPKSCEPKSCEPCAPCCKPHELLQCPTIAAYNAPARIDIQCGWDVWADASFTYWQAIQENMEPATSHTAVVTTVGTNNFGFVNMDFKYKPGFKVGVGMSFDYDNWDACAEYTYYRGTVHRSAAMSTTAALAGSGYLANWLETINAYSLSASINAFTAKWRLAMDLVDADLGRWYYVGTQLTFRPSIGARAAFIRQNRNGVYTDILSSTLVGVDRASTHSWGVGPRFTLDMNWMLGDGFRFFGNNSVDVLFTRYKVRDKSVNTFSATSTLTTNSYQEHINTLRPHVDLEWGIGWGTYLDDHNWHLDLSASYGFQVFWNQNMFRFSTGLTNPRTLSPTGDLFVHGLTATVKLDF